MKKYFIPFLSLCLAILLSFSSTKKVVLIDVGHGGEDLGAVAGDYSEKDIVLKISRILNSLNEGKDLEIVLSRDADSAPSLEERIEFIKKLKPDMVISLHLNHNLKEKEKRGKEIYIQDNEKSRILGEMLSKKFGDAKVQKQDLLLLKKSASPTIVAELGYLSNQEDLEYLTSEMGQTEIAKQILEFIKEN